MTTRRAGEKRLENYDGHARCQGGLKSPNNETVKVKALRGTCTITDQNPLEVAQRENQESPMGLWTLYAHITAVNGAKPQGELAAGTALWPSSWPCQARNLDASSL